MAFFDVSRNWVILAPQSLAAQTAAAELSRHIVLLRKQAGFGQKGPAIEAAEGAAPDDSVPVIILNAGTGSRDRNGFTWRLGRDRIEIYGDSCRGLCNGVFDFLAALGIRWPEGGQEELPRPPAKGVETPAPSATAYPLEKDKAYVPSEPVPSPANRRRLVIPDTVKPRDLEALIQRAARNRIDALIFPLRGKSLKKSRRRILEIAEKYALSIEWGGWELSLLVPRRYFFINRELFRMDSGKRTKQYNFCPTNHETINLLKKQSARIFPRAGTASETASPGTGPNVYHLWPDRGEERTWCSCPACRAFSPEEQSRIAVNAAADAIAEIDPQALLSWYEEGDDPLETELPLRGNLFRLKELPDLVSV